MHITVPARFFVAVTALVFLSVSCPAHAQTPSVQRVGAIDRRAFDQQMLRYSKQSGRTILLEALPEVPPGRPQATDSNFDAFLDRYDLGSLASPGVLIVYRKPTLSPPPMSVTVAEAAQVMVDVESLASQFTPVTRAGGGNIRTMMTRLLGGLSREQLKAAQGEGIVVGSLDAASQKVVAEIGGHCHLGGAMSSLWRTKDRLTLLQSADTKLCADTSGGSASYRAVFPDTGGRTAYADYDNREARFNSDDSPEISLPLRRIPLSAGVESPDSPLVYEGTIASVFQSLARTYPKRFAMLTVDDCLARKPLVVYSINNTSGARLCKGVATLYNLRVKDAGEKLLLTRHRPRPVTNAAQLRGELLRILPAPMIRMMTAGAESKDTPPSPPVPDVATEAGDPAPAVPEVFRFTNQTHYHIEASAASKLTELLSASLTEAKVRQGYAHLSESPNIYDRLVANSVIALALPGIDSMLQEPPAYISNLTGGKLTIRLEEFAGERTAHVSVEAADSQRPGRSSRMGMTAYSISK
ncbi:MAG: hypothetical protein H7145_22165 [Akkermansiaceae bacterium]|nr:hypothetical protein [Armatimonadota bacterium]